MQKNDIVTVLAEGMGTQGEGIAHAEGITLFIPFLLPGERARVRVLKVKDGIGYGRLEEILTPAEERVRPRCPVFGKCGGCRLQHLRYREQLKFKARLVRETLRKIGGIEAPVEACVRSERDYGYRNKLQLPVGRIGGKNVVGFFAERSHRIVPTDTCPLHPEWADKVIAALLGFMEKCGLDGYDEFTHTGQIRHIVVREVKKKFLVTLVVTVPEFKGIDYFKYLLGQIFSEYSLFLNLNTAETNVVLGDTFTHIFGAESYEGTEAGVVYSAGPNTFLQVNDGVRSKLYAAVAEYAEGVFADCYAGGGLLTALLAQKCERVYGIEVVPEAHACAVQLAAQNGLSEHMLPILGRVEEVLPALAKKEKRLGAVLDPPRAGVDRNVLKTIMASGIDPVVMISCNPATLARDLGILTGTLEEQPDGSLVKCEDPHPMYQIECIRPYDMFPQTRHIETLVVLSHKKPDGHIGVKVEFGEEEGQISLKEAEKRVEERKPKEKVTYKMIQEYIEKTYGFKVHTAYIAEVKRDLGLPMYDAPNAVEELKRPRSHPSPQMVEAIKETLKHFEII